MPSRPALDIPSWALYNELALLGQKATRETSDSPPTHAPAILVKLRGEVSEWLKVPLSKSGVAQVTVGSNPTLSASFGPRCHQLKRPAFGRHVHGRGAYTHGEVLEWTIRHDWKSCVP